MLKISQAKKEPSMARKIFYRAFVIGSTGSLTGVLFAKPLVGFFHNFAPWVGPVVLVGFIGIIVLAALLVPLFFQARTDK